MGSPSRLNTRPRRLLAHGHARRAPRCRRPSCRGASAVGRPQGHAAHLRFPPRCCCNLAGERDLLAAELELERAGEGVGARRGGSPPSNSASKVAPMTWTIVPIIFFFFFASWCLRSGSAAKKKKKKKKKKKRGPKNSGASAPPRTSRISLVIWDCRGPVVVQRELAAEPSRWAFSGGVLHGDPPGDLLADVGRLQVAPGTGAAWAYVAGTARRGCSGVAGSIRNNRPEGVVAGPGRPRRRRGRAARSAAWVSITGAWRPALEK